ncbi:hypothetical protein [Paracoccus sp. PAR01]|uniref:hypothetical protein n=1 Tax=Paracoccus sp. PAR01 TaxID=2769282 RepID=UPI00177FFCE6|nr:hypothetical protein [Paracoccus sp. PAR01]MBD9526047.1 hypothetical protein [Paracoccus sp. PAR01]
MSALESLRRVAAEQSRDRLPLIGAVASVVWLALVALFAWLGSGPKAEPSSWLVWLMGVALPLGLIWFGIWSARSLALLRQEADDLRASLHQMRLQPDDPAEPRLHPRRPPAPQPRPAPERRAAAPAPDNAQSRLDIDPAPIPELTPTELFLALNFPDGPEDHEAIRCLHLALGDPALARLIRAAQDVVTLLAGQGVYMDDLELPETDPALWRSLAGGARGAEVAGLAVIEDEAALDAATGLMRKDEVFRDVAHHFLRHFDRLLSRRAETDDAVVLSVLGESRSGRAFLLLAQASGMLTRADS